MKFWKKDTDKLEKCQGIRKEVFPIIQDYLACFLCDIAKNSSYFLLGIYDITTENFYKHDASKYIKKITQSAYVVDYYEVFKPFMSDNFSIINNSDKHKNLIAEFFRYYLLRFHPLITYCRFSNWPDEVGPNAEDIKHIVPYSCEYFRQRYPFHSKRLFSEGVESTSSIYCELAESKILTQKYDYNDGAVQDYIFDESRIWNEFVENFLITHNNNNIYRFIGHISQQYNDIFWNDYRAQYMSMMRLWSMDGALKGGGPFYKELWANRAKKCQDVIAR